VDSVPFRRERSGELFTYTKYIHVTKKPNFISQNTGFSLRATAHSSGCGGIYHSFSGTLSYPRADDNSNKYPNGVECIWEIRSRAGFHPRITFSGRFDIEMNADCSKDYVQVTQTRNLPFYTFYDFST
jgi:hypothetical protein